MTTYFKNSTHMSVCFKNDAGNLDRISVSGENLEGGWDYERDSRSLTKTEGMRVALGVS